jgi:putative ABC transport system permease protein
MVSSVIGDLRFAARTLGRTWGFTVVTTATLALGFALTTSTVAVVNAYLIRSLPYAAAERLYHVRYAPPGPWEPRGMSGLDWNSVDEVVEFPITAQSETFYLAGSGYAQSVRGLRVGPGFVDGLGIRPVLGRSLTSDDFGGTADRPALIGHALWRDRYGSDPGIVGRVIRADAEYAQGREESLRIIGILPPGFYYGRDSAEMIDLLVPLTTAARTYMVRLRDGVPPGLAEQRITAAARSVAGELPADWSGVQLASVHGRYVEQVRPVLVGITVASGLVLVIVCANVAVLMLLRAMRRQKEMAVRTALGASRVQLARMLVFESSLICVTALAAGLVCSRVLLGLLAPLIETQLGRSVPGGAGAIGLDSTVLLIAGSIGVLSALLLSFLPLLAPWQRRLAAALRRDGTMTADGYSTRQLRSGLIAFEVAGTLILLVGCGLLIRSVVGMVRTDFGFEPERLVRGRVVLRGTDYPDAQAFSRFYEQFTERLSTVTRAPVVFASWPPFFDLPRVGVEVDGEQGRSSPAGGISVGAGYFSTLGISLRSGREFTSADVAGNQPVAVISGALAARLWPDGAAIGRRIRSVEETPAGPRAGPWRTVVGVAADVRQTYGDAEVGDLYIPLRPAERFGFFYIRTDHPLPSLLATMRTAAAELDPHAMVGPPRSVTGENRQLAGTTFLTTMLSGFAGIAAFLALLGIYGVTAYTVQQRQREIAIRMALGAPGSAVVRLFLKESAAVLAAGLAVGLIGASAATRVLENQLYGVGAFDPLTLAAACLLMAAAGVMATWWPARRASLRSPITVLKEG